MYFLIERNITVVLLQYDQDEQLKKRNIKTKSFYFSSSYQDAKRQRRPTIDQRKKFSLDEDQFVEKQNHKRLVHQCKDQFLMVCQLIFHSHDNQKEEYLFDMFDIINKHFVNLKNKIENKKKKRKSFFTDVQCFRRFHEKKLMFHIPQNGQLVLLNIHVVFRYLPLE